MSEVRAHYPIFLNSPVKGLKSPLKVHLLIIIHTYWKKIYQVVIPLHCINWLFAWQSWKLLIGSYLGGAWELVWFTTRTSGRSTPVKPVLCSRDPSVEGQDWLVGYLVYWFLYFVFDFLDFYIFFIFRFFRFFRFLDFLDF